MGCLCGLAVSAVKVVSLHTRTAPPSTEYSEPSADGPASLPELCSSRDGLSELQVRPRQPLEQNRQRLAVERERAELRDPGQFVPPGHRRYPDLADRGVRRHDETLFGRFLEQQVERPLLQLDLEAFLIGKRHQRATRLLQGLVAFDAEFLFGQS